MLIIPQLSTKRVVAWFSRGGGAGGGESGIRDPRSLG
jgi:hypothetical protein